MSRTCKASVGAERDRLPAAHGGDVPAIALTAYAKHEDVSRAEASGFQLHVSKPVALEDLVEAIKGLSFSKR